MVKCDVPDCKKRAALVVGDCRYCHGHYCGEHRLPEDHRCANMQACKDSSFQRNQEKLLHEKCVSSRV